MPEVTGGCLGGNLWGGKGSRTGQREKLNCAAITTKHSGDPRESSGAKTGLKRLSFIKTRCSGLYNPSVSSP